MSDSICKVEHEGAELVSHDFIAIINTEDGGSTLVFNTDAMSLGIATKMLAKTFLECYEDCASSEQAEIISILGERFSKGIGEVGYE